MLRFVMTAGVFAEALEQCAMGATGRTLVSASSNSAASVFQLLTSLSISESRFAVLVQDLRTASMAR